MKQVTDLLVAVKHLMTGRMLFIIGSILALLITFQLGVIVGVHKASLGFQMGDNYYRAFGNDRGMHGPGGAFPTAHGAAGQIVSVTLPTFTVDDHGIEKVIHITDNTKIRHLRDEASTTAIVVGDFAIILGEPNNTAQIDAQFIRVLPPPPTVGTTTPTH